MFHAMSSANLHTFKGMTPTIGQHVFLATGSQVIGDLRIGRESSVWFNAVIRADVMPIDIGERSNVQDNCVIHVTSGTGPTRIGNDVTIGHNAVVHACTIEDNCLIGMGAVILDGAVISKNSLVAAGALVPPGKSYPPGSLIKGSPAAVARPLRPEEIDEIKASAQHYVDLAKAYRPSTV